MDRPTFEVDFFQIADDSLMKAHREDGYGWEWGWADWQRDWMDATPNRFAYRCLPLTIVNQTGWWIRNPIGFTARWSGRPEPGHVVMEFDSDGELWARWVNNQFGQGIITWNTPFLIRTRPGGSRLLVCGPANYFKANAHPLTALIESDWMTMSFTMNWKLMAPNVPTRFEAGEPLFQAIPVATNVCADLESASVTYRKLAEDGELLEAYNTWNRSRTQFHEQKSRGEVKPDDWQKDYFQGRDLAGREATTNKHMTKIKPPPVRFSHATHLMDPEASAAKRRGNGDAAHQDSEPRITTKAATMNPTIPNRSDTSPSRRVTGAGSPAAVLEALLEQAEKEDEASVSTQPTARVDDEWRRWIAENLLLENSAESLVAAMTNAGITAEEARAEIEAAQQSPHLRGSERLRNRLRKRDWLLATYRKLNRMHPRSSEVERRHKLSRAEFIDQYYSTNRPVVITGMLDDWPALAKWNLDEFARRFGDREVEVQFGRNAGENYEIEREKYARMVPFREFIELVRTAGVTNDFYLTANNNSHNKRALAGLWDDITQIPEYLSDKDRMGGFFWFGPAGTITPFHHDLTNNFMAQVVGSKRVLLAPSWDTPLMANYLHCFSKHDGRRMEPNPRPASLDEPQILEVLLRAGEILFLPIGCWHFVEGVEISVTMSFTNFLVDNDFSSFYTTYQVL